MHLYSKPPYDYPYGPPPSPTYTNDLDTFKSILADVAWPDSAAVIALDIYNDMHTYYRELFADTNYLDAAGATIRSEVYSKMLDIQNDLITRSTSVSSVWRLYSFELHRDLALIHRSFNHRADGINVINNCINDFEDSSSVLALTEWKCILNREQMLIDSVIPYDSLNLYRECICKRFQDSFIRDPNDTIYTPFLDSTGYSIFKANNGAKAISDTTANAKLNKPNASPMNQNKETQNFILYPNPAENKITLLCNKGMSEIEILGNTGNMVLTQKVNNSRQETVDISLLARGIYIVKVQTEERMYVTKLVVNK